MSTFDGGGRFWTLVLGTFCDQQQNWNECNDYLIRFIIKQSCQIRILLKNCLQADSEVQYRYYLRHRLSKIAYIRRLSRVIRVFDRTKVPSWHVRDQNNESSLTVYWKIIYCDQKLQLWTKHKVKVTWRDCHADSRLQPVRFFMPPAFEQWQPVTYLSKRKFSAMKIGFLAACLIHSFSISSFDGGTDEFRRIPKFPRFLQSW